MALPAFVSLRHCAILKLVVQSLIMSEPAFIANACKEGRSHASADHYIAGGDARSSDLDPRSSPSIASKSHRRGRRILLMIGMEDEDPVERPGKNRIYFIFLARHREAHVQEI